jgi:hypothetical protein
MLVYILSSIPGILKTEKNKYSVINPTKNRKKAFLLTTDIYSNDKRAKKEIKREKEII